MWIRSGDPPKFDRSQFRILMDNISEENLKPSDPLASWYIMFFGENELVRLVGIEPSKGLLKFRKSIEDILRFKSKEEAEKRLNDAIEQGEFEITSEE